jgi:hypothetical protein
VQVVPTSPKLGLQEAQVEGVPVQVKQLLVQDAQGTVPSEVCPEVHWVQVFPLNPKFVLHDVHVVSVPEQARQLVEH